jgi:tRNA G10  N-methylase Trm11
MEPILISENWTFLIARGNFSPLFLGIIRNFIITKMQKDREVICIALPIQVNGLGEVDHMAKDLARYIEGLGYKTIESHLVYIHSSLTREIMVYEKI